MAAYNGAGRRTGAVPSVLGELLNVSGQLRALADQGLPDSVLFRRHVLGLADLVEHEATKLIRQWLDAVRPCDACEVWFPAREMVTEGFAIARSQLCPSCAGGRGPPAGR